MFSLSFWNTKITPVKIRLEIKKKSGVLFTTWFKFSHQVSVSDNCDRWRQSFVIHTNNKLRLSLFDKSLLTSYELGTDGVWHFIVYNTCWHFQWWHSKKIMKTYWLCTSDNLCQFFADKLRLSIFTSKYVYLVEDSCC